ncbi:sulfotransferase family protein [Thalassovita taeanensis]|uniref:Sulfotransferase family protein n=1 Tax=Thalassovita taeanensis TaxID=657014 RepID=A0A1H9JKY1_9RHOB|nr:sulfotransferase family protein [Thalassovita taeanensis]SEQ87418.1 hypothetical protein SAMN04488092_11558 [Thalassovita taeanensis]
MRIAMWSGPRNLSTAMMYAFGARADFAVVDEPFYAAYLGKTGLDHPMRGQILASQSRDAAEVGGVLRGPVPKGRAHYYQKHMTQHMIPSIPRGWMADVVNVFLIRHPARVVASFAKKYDYPTLEDIGFAQQTELFDHVVELGQTPIIIDSGEIRREPEAMLKKLCDAISLPFDPAMLHWPEGGHPDDGVWAAHWYGAVHRSTSFAAAEGDLPKLSGAAADLAARALPHYERLAALKL